MGRTIIVDGGSHVLRDPSTRVLFRYENGEVLVDTDAHPASEGEKSESETPAAAGVVLPEDLRQHVEAARRALAGADPNARIAAYIELRGPADGAMLAALKTTGLSPQQFVPNNTYLCTGPIRAFKEASGLAFVASVIPLDPNLKSVVNTSEDDREFTTVDVIASSALTAADVLAGDIATISGVQLDGTPETAGSLIRVPARVNQSGQQALLKDPRILRIEDRQPRIVEDEVADLILVGGYDANAKPQGSFVKWLDDNGVNGTAITIGIVDQGVDTTHPAFAGRIVDLTGGAKDWHGTFVAGHAAGCYMDDKDKDGFVYGIGMAPNADLVVQDNKKNATTLCGETVTTKGPSGASGSIQNNSWGAGTHDPMDYQSLEATYDGLVRNSAASGDPVPLTLCFSAGNDGTAGLTRPKAAKNLIITGNSENFRPDVGGAEADNIQEVYSGAHASSQGNCGDGRIRPHVVAPGEWTASANYDSHPGEKEYVNDKITWGGGSSGASPKTAGACAILTHWWRNHDGGVSPSPAMLRALVVNGAEPIASGGTIPNNLQGWGRLNIDNIIRDDVHRTFIDQSILLTSHGDSRGWTICPSDPSKPIHMTLAWTDPPGSPGTGTKDAPAVVNQLALRANTKGMLYHGNQFARGWSVASTDTSKEGWDNTQCIFLQPSDVGDRIDVTVTALSLAMNCLTNSADTPQQDFALVIRNGFVDQGSTPANVFLVIDSGAASPPASGGDHYAPGSSDHNEATDPVPAASTGRDVGSEPSSSSGSDAWWNEAGSPSTETERHKPPVPSSVIAGASAGVNILEAAGSTIASHIDPTVPISDLTAALAALEASWTSSDPLSRHAAVLVVGDATRVTNADIAALRRMAFHGELWVLSTTQSILGFLAQRIHRRSRVHYRLCSDSNDLARAVRDTLAETAGLQQLVTRSAKNADGSTSVSLDVVPDDTDLVIQVQSSSADATKLRVVDGSNKSFNINTSRPPKGVRVRRMDKALQLDWPVVPEAAGTWTITVSPGSAAIDVYARTQLKIRPTGATNNGQEPMVALHGGEQAKFSHLRLEKPGLVGSIVGAKGAEDARAIEVSITTSRIDEHGRSGEVPKEALAPTIGTVIKAPSVRDGARVLDLVGNVHGAVNGGHRFSRVVRAGVVQLEPRSRWRARLAPEQTFVTPVDGVSVDRQGNEILAVVLRRNSKTRRLAVPSAEFRRLLATVELTAKGMLFRVRGSELISVIRTLKGATPTSEAVRSESAELVALTGLEPATPATEDTKSSDYSGASRYVQAKYFGASPNSRTINKVVIHITDGGSNINGTISWFQDPKKKDGSPLQVSAHYVVGQDGEVVQMVAEKDVAYHANAANADSIGIEHCARSKGALGANDAGLPPTATQYAASAALVQDICRRYALPLDRAHIVGHNEADTNTTHTGCPTNAWDWTYYMSQVLQPPPGDAGSGSGSGGDAGSGSGSGGDAGSGSGSGGDAGSGSGSGSDAGSGSGSGSDAGSGSGSPSDGGTPGPETVRTATASLSQVLTLAPPRLATLIPRRATVSFTGNGGPGVGPGSKPLDGDTNVFLRPAWVDLDRVPYIPLPPTPQLGDPITVAGFLVWADPAPQRMFYALAQPISLKTTLVVNRENAPVNGGTTTKITGGTASIVLSMYQNDNPRLVERHQHGLLQVLENRGYAHATGWVCLPVALRNLNPSLIIPQADLAGKIATVSAEDAGTVVFVVPLSETGALDWLAKFNNAQGASLVGACSITASYLTQGATAIDFGTRTFASDLGALLGNAGPTDVNVVDPQSTVIVRVIATAHELIDSLTVDVSPTEGAPATSLAFTKEGGQANIPITSNRLDAVRVAYNATVRFRPPGWPVITQTGTLDLSKADFDIWVKPDSWITTYTVCVMLFDAQNKVIAPGSAGNNDTMTIRLDYRHPALAGPLSLVTQADSQQVINVPFPNPPGAQAPATLSMTILGVRSGVAAGPKQRALTYDETVIVVKVYVNGNIDITTNKDHTAEDSIEANVLSTMAHLM